jgi:ribosomal protein L6P/L9E
LVNNMVQGVSQGFERKLQLVGVGYKAQAKLLPIDTAVVCEWKCHQQPI